MRKTKKRTTPKLRYACWKIGCNARFKSYQARDAHIPIAHPEPPKPKRTETQRLGGGSDLKVGRKVKFIQTGTIKKITHFLNSDTVEVDVDIFTDSWERL